MLFLSKKRKVFEIFLKVPSLARSGPKPLKVPSLARSAPNPLSIFTLDRRAPDVSLPSLSTSYQLVVNDEMNKGNFGSLIFLKL